MYHAKVHPEQYSNTLSDDQIKEIYSSINYVCSTALDVLADSEKFPEHWLFKHRWGKGKKDQPAVLPNGDKITYLKVGGRTSAVVPAVQKKTGAVAKDIDGEANGATNSKRKRTVKQEDDSEADEKPEPKSRGSKRKSDAAVKDEGNNDQEASEKAVGRRRSARSRG